MSQLALSAAAPPVAAPATSRVKLALMVLGFILLWSSAFSVAKIAIADCPPLLFLAARFLTAGVIMMALAPLSGIRWTLSRRDVAVFAALGIANQAVYLGIGYIALKTVSAGLAALIISANPIVTAVFAVAVLGERMTWRKVLGLLLGLGGVAFIVQSRLALGTDQLGGIVLAVLALFSLVGGTILFKFYAPKQGLWIGNGVQSLAAGIAVLPFALGFESVHDIVPTMSLLASFAYNVLLVSIFAYLLWFKILQVSGATAASSYHFLIPPLGMLFGWLILGEHLETADLFGIIPVALGIYLVTRPAAART
ncbi:MAG: DMT family transporter [Proteobacteria bacterium]|nr:DMT family transporter [Pseudomonadota bacterium]